jgi:DNA-directed RNA polymerase subunit RPC12/RpoP
VIKFHCLNCGQKLAVSDDGVNAVISCTNCKERIVVPPYSISEYFSAEPLRQQPKAIGNNDVELIPPNRERVGSGPTAMRAALIPHLARMMMNRLVQALFAQRESLIDTQAEATRRMAELEERIGRAQTNVERKIALYESRIAELESQLAVKEEENRELMRTNFQLAKKALEVETNPRPGRVNLSDAGFLLRA